LRAIDVEAQLVTETGAAILTTLAAPDGVDITLERVGYGAGAKRSTFRTSFA